MKLEIPGALRPTKEFWKWFESSHLNTYEWHGKDYEFRSIITERWFVVYHFIYN